MTDRLVGGVRHQVLLGNIGDIGRLFVLGKQVIKRLILALSDLDQIDRLI
jgi:hypothetical protein